MKIIILKRAWWLALTLVACLFAGSGYAQAASTAEGSEKGTVTEFGGLTTSKIAEIFKGYNASFVIYDPDKNSYLRYNPENCAQRLSPCSTFKIPNALIGLETGVIRDENFAFKWDGTKYDISAHNRDHTLQSAMTNSVVWYFQRLAAKVGEARMNELVHKLQYGNEDTSAGLTKFWLKSSLKISADEQVVFLNKLVHDELPVSKRSQAIVRGLLRLDDTDKGTLYGKTGSDGLNGKRVLGWFCGYVVQPGKIYVFATNIQAADNAWGRKARELTKQVLNQAGML